MTMINPEITRTIEEAKQRIARYEQLVEEALAEDVIAFLKGEDVISHRSDHFRYRPIAAIHIKDKECTMMDIEFNNEKSPTSKKFLANDQNAIKYLLDILDKGKARITIKEFNSYRHGGDKGIERNYFNEVLFTVSGLSINTWGVFAGVYEVKGYMSKETLHKIKQLDLARQRLSEMDKKIEDIKKAYEQKDATIKEATSQCEKTVRSKEREFRKSYSSFVKQTTMIRGGNK
jgi:hypothetical protein